MRTKILSIIILLAVPFFGTAQSFERGTRIQKNQRGIIESAEFLSADRSVHIPATANEFFSDILQVRTGNRFEQRPHRSRREGFVHQHFQQYYNGIRVEGGGYNFHFRNGEMF